MSRKQGWLAAFAISIFAWAMIFFAASAFAQPQRIPYDNGGRPYVGIALICGTLNPGEAVGCERVRTRALFDTFEQCVAAMPDLLVRQTDAITARYPRANIRVDWNCIVAEGVFDS